jgi:hypothetical protein
MMSVHNRGRLAHFAFLGLTLVLSPSALGAQAYLDLESPPGDSITVEPPRHGLALMGGYGQSFGWMGASLDHYFADGLFSGFLSAGYVPEQSDVYQTPSGPTAAAGIRAYLLGTSRHRGFLEVSVAEQSNGVKVILDEAGAVVGSEDVHRYGPGFQVGYRFTSRGGFTLIAQGGVGYEFDGWGQVPMLGIGFGYTWR